MASYTKISTRNWKAIVSLGYDYNGKRIRKTKQGFKSKKEAEIWVNDICSKHNEGFISTSDSNILLKDFIEKWFNEYKINTGSIGTRNNYKSRINTHIIPQLGHLRLNQLTNIDVQNFYNNLINSGQKPSSAKKIIEALSNCLRYAQKNKLIYSLPTDIIRIPVEKPKIKFWTKDEVDYYLSEIKNTSLYTPIFIALLTGLRIGELCGLRWESIDFNNNTLTVDHQVINNKLDNTIIFTDRLKTSASYRKIILPQVLISHLKDIKGNAAESDFILLNSKGTMCNPRNLSMQFSKSIAKYSTKNESKSCNNYKPLTKITFHALRHTHATLLISNGENIKVVSQRLGHKSITETLDTYTHIVEDMNINTANLLDSMF